MGAYCYKHVINYLFMLFRLYWPYLLENNFMIGFSYYCRMFLRYRPVHNCQNIEAYSEPCQRSMMDLLAKMLNDFQPLSFFAPSKIFDRVMNTPLEYVHFVYFV